MRKASNLCKLYIGKNTIWMEKKKVKCAKYNVWNVLNTMKWMKWMYETSYLQELKSNVLFRSLEAFWLLHCLS